MAIRSRSLPARMLIFLFKTILWFLLVTSLWVLLYRFVPPPITATMLMDEQGATRDWTSMGNIDRSMAVAAIAAEDGNFCLHNGFDFAAIEQAWEERQSGQRQRGGSSISQQTAKNVFLWQDGGWVRKGLETYFTVLIELLWGKNRIMEVYLNVAETGIGTYGVEAGAQRYFGHGANRLSDTEAAQIIAVFPSPRTRSPSGGWTARYAGRIVGRMQQVRASTLDDCI
ncbi:monofunctional biosynthetic peptidoglycan transglycosylase [Parasphingopyxis lamellibrachiae]|uniref:Biosynthetic peptidoglycan transglycosylase n=1 Tax=Parasphingopyxis lamellibrachiae TaxID=680125 RepID=A0A3D9FEG8_9SPHN|nr:monofunctional biosynthetic peptidoglycan transglycosylase [Parasphingopyxis lamellibrachiae]RED15441.1 monofunctional biosynthetic peptidoglycan transglycosylase [Parasphingopyxis lamellibrachiae]